MKIKSLIINSYIFIKLLRVNFADEVVDLKIEEIDSPMNRKCLIVM